MDFINGNVSYRSLIPPRKKRILKFKQLNVEKLLDIGCGNGEFSLILKQAFGVQEVYGIEIAAQAAEIARNKGINVVCTNLNEADIPFDNDAFDMVFAGEIIEHLFSPDHFLDEIYRVLRPGGCCIITTPNLASWHCRLCLLLGRQPYCMPVSSKYRGAGTFLSRTRTMCPVDVRYIDSSGGGGLTHIQFFTSRALKDLLKAHGFQIMRVSGTPFVLTFFVPFLLRETGSLIEIIVSSLFPSLASGIIIMVTKP